MGSIERSIKRLWEYLGPQVGPEARRQRREEIRARLQRVIDQEDQEQCVLTEEEVEAGARELLEELRRGA